MPISQYYETTVVDSETDLAIEITAIPKSALATTSPSDVIHDLEEAEYTFTPLPTDIVPFLVGILLAEASPQLEPSNAPVDNVSRIDAVRFAESVFQDAYVLIENSPPKGEKLKDVLANVVVGGATTTAGLLKGYDAAFVVLVITPTAIVLIGAARGVADGLRKGLSKVLKDTIVDRLGPKRKKKSRK